MMPFAAVEAQDARGRVTSTIVADALNQLPAADAGLYNQLMGEIAATGSEGVEMIAGMLKPAAEGVNNSPMEYALNGVAWYVTAEGNGGLRDAVREGLRNAADKCGDETNKAFLLTVLERCATAEDAGYFAALLGDDYQGGFAARALATLPGTEETVLSLMQEQNANGLSRARLAHVAAYKDIEGAEDILLMWAAEGGEEAEMVEINRALASCGTAKSVKPLGAAAKAVDYAFEATDAYASYVALLTKLAQTDPAAALKAAKKLMKASPKVNVRSAGLEIVARVEGAGVLPTLEKAMKDGNREYRVGALRLADDFADDAVYARFAAMIPSLEGAAKADVLNWLGTAHAASQIDAVAAAMNDADAEVAAAAVAAASKIGGDKALAALVAKAESLQVPANDADEAEWDAYGAEWRTVYNAFMSFNGRVNDAVVEMLGKGAAAKSVAMEVLKERRIPEAADAVLAMAEAGDKVADIIPNVVTEKDFEVLCDMYENGKCEYAAVNESIIDKPASEQVAMIEARMQKAGGKAEMYYPVLAATGSKDVIPILVEGYKANKKSGNVFFSMMMVADDAMIPYMYEVATENADFREAALQRYIDLTQASKNLNAQVKYMNYRKVLEMNPKSHYKNMALRALSATQTYQGMMLAAEYLDDAETAQAAANTILEIATKHPEFYSAEVKALLEKVGATLNDSDAVYKRKDIEKFISENTERASHSVISKLTPEEEAEGFEMLFDGVSMDKWQGNLDAYQPIDGYMYVTAAYGTTGNLYSKKEYKDFVLRFEFCFDRAGVNNGVGIRAEMGKDAAYYGMEIQILDHDDPIYANLREYQVHGSVYGIIPAKRIVSPELGQWNTEEIRVQGDRIKVTVNGEVIVDGNIRTACKGHNVAPDGSDHNPYTVDHLNHPGLFNKTGYIGFLGHGEGLKLRNVRIKEL